MEDLRPQRACGLSKETVGEAEFNDDRLARLLDRLGKAETWRSWWGLLALVPMVPVIVWRLVEEERLLMRELPGYAVYLEPVRYRQAPYVW